jgi:hypothetical protein
MTELWEIKLVAKYGGHGASFELKVLNIIFEIWQHHKPSESGFFPYFERS